MNRFFKENNVVLKKEPGDDELLKQGTVDFYTFSYYMSSCAGVSPEAEDIGGNMKDRKSVV